MRQHPRPSALDRLRIVADRASVNFVNTVDPRTNGDAVDLLQSYEDLASWGVRAGALPRATADRLVRLARRDRTAARRALTRARDLREATYRLFAAVASGERPVPADVARLTAAFVGTLTRAEFAPHERGFRWRPKPDLDLVRSVVARDAIALLESPLVDRLKLCPGSGDCGWVFLDTSKNASRRWCSMAGCGNRAKARRHLRRLRNPRTPARS